MKFLFWLLLLGVLWWLWRTRRRERGPGPAPRPPAEPEMMIRCAHCGVYCPRSDSVGEGGRDYCCEAHRRLGPGAG